MILVSLSSDFHALITVKRYIFGCFFSKAVQCCPLKLAVNAG